MLTWLRLPWLRRSEMSEKILQVSRAFLASIGNSSIGNPFQPFARPDFPDICLFVYLRGTAGQFESQFVMINPEESGSTLLTFPIREENGVACVLRRGPGPRVGALPPPTPYTRPHPHGTHPVYGTRVHRDRPIGRPRRRIPRVRPGRGRSRPRSLPHRRRARRARRSHTDRRHPLRPRARRTRRARLVRRRRARHVRRVVQVVGGRRPGCHRRFSHQRGVPEGSPHGRRVDVGAAARPAMARLRRRRHAARVHIPLPRHPDELEALQDENVKRMAEGSRASYAAGWEMIKTSHPRVAEAIDDAGDESSPSATQEDFDWARATAHTRAMSGKVGGGPCAFIVPGVDLANHSFEPNCEYGVSRGWQIVPAHVGLRGDEGTPGWPAAPHGEGRGFDLLRREDAQRAVDAALRLYGSAKSKRAAADGVRDPRGA